MKAEHLLKDLPKEVSDLRSMRIEHLLKGLSKEVRDGVFKKPDAFLKKILDIIEEEEALDPKTKAEIKRQVNEGHKEIKERYLNQVREYYSER